MFSRASRNSLNLVFRRFQSQASAGSSSTKSSFNNKYNFNINPPPVHEYWNLRNSTVLIAFIPLYIAVGYLTKYTAGNLEGFEGLLNFADSEKSPLKEIKFSEPQTTSK